MTVASVICEYNPFHTGHKYQLDYIRRELMADYIICIMSGDFAERGEPAVFSKEIRTKWALENGADAVFLLPCRYAVASADLFAFGAVSFLDRMGCVDYLCFGSECGDTDKLTECAHVLDEAGTIDVPAIKELMKKGHTFPKARSLLFSDLEDILSGSNNILALEYIRALNRLGSKIKPFTHRRLGQDYSDSSIDESQSYLSASAVRTAILSGETKKVTKFMPYTLPSDYVPVSADNFSNELYYAMLSGSGSLEEFGDVNNDLANRINNKLKDYKDFSSFAESLKSKNFTHARISRALIHVLLGMKDDSASAAGKLSQIEGIRLLGFKKKADKLLTEISQKGNLKIITKVPAIYEELNDTTREMLDKELFVSTLYDKIAGISTPEYSKKIITI